MNCLKQHKKQNLQALAFWMQGLTEDSTAFNVEKSMQIIELD